jgi:hypothetical protein
MDGKREKIATSLLLQVFWKEDASVVENADLPGRSSMSALTYISLADVLKKFIALRPFVISGGGNNHW